MSGHSRTNHARCGTVPVNAARHAISPRRSDVAGSTGGPVAVSDIDIGGGVLSWRVYHEGSLVDRARGQEKAHDTTEPYLRALGER
jgi:hypothetical protein